MISDKKYKMFEFYGVISKADVIIKVELYNEKQDNITPTLIIKSSSGLNRKINNRIKSLAIYDSRAFRKEDCKFIYDNQYTTISDMNINEVYSDLEINELLIQILQQDEFAIMSLRK